MIIANTNRGKLGINALCVLAFIRESPRSRSLAEVRTRFGLKYAGAGMILKRLWMRGDIVRDGTPINYRYRR